MTKATSPVHPKSATINRRTLLAGVAAALPTATATAAIAAPVGAVLAPSPLGLRYLKLEEQRRTIVSRHPEIGFAGSYENSEAGKAAYDEEYARVDAPRGELELAILNAPLGLSNVVDRAIVSFCYRQINEPLAAYLPGSDADLDEMSWDERSSNQIVAAVFALAGLPLEWDDEAARKEREDDAAA